MGKAQCAAQQRPFRPMYNLPPRSPTSLVEIWRSHDGLSLRQRNLPRGPVGDSTGEGASWRRELLFEFAALGTAVSSFLHFALVHGGGRHDFWVVHSFSL
jgi:hypothetical protein